ARILAAEAMFRTATLGDPTILEQSTDPIHNNRLRVFAAATLTLTDRANMKSIIREALSSDDPAARYIAADVIPLIGDRDIDIPTLIDKKDLANSDFESLYFVRALAIFGTEAARKELIGFLKHTDPTIRSRAAFAMAEAWHIDHTDRLIALLDDPALSVRVRAAQALFTLSNPTSPYRYLSLR
ncbi:MAG: HEAT repeat domain-containing protein, partial [Rhodothermales bacterium]